MKTIEDLDFQEKKVILRLDLDLPIENGKVKDSTRIQNSLPTVEKLLEKKCPIIIIGHLGRPGGKPNSNLSTRLLLPTLKDILGREIIHFPSIFSPEVKDAIFQMKSGDIFLLENLRFDPGEEACDPAFAQKLVSLGEVYVIDAFGVCHRHHASVALLPRLLPSAAGLRLAEEVLRLQKVIDNPERPLVAIIGGAKIETKLSVIENLGKIADWVLVGGKLPFEIAHQTSAKDFGPKVVIGKLVSSHGDIDEETISQFCQVIKRAKMIVWNGPLGVVEDERFEKGTEAVAQAIDKSETISIVGGGDTVAALKKFGLLSHFTWVSSGGGAMLEFLAGKELPGIKVLE